MLCPISAIGREWLSIYQINSLNCGRSGMARPLGETATSVAHGGKAWDHSALVRALEIMANHEIGQKSMIRARWPEAGIQVPPLDGIKPSAGLEEVQERLRSLAPSDEAQRLLQARAVQLSGEMARATWLFWN
jgi:hypothetical protein